MPDLKTLQELAANAGQKSEELRNGRRATAKVISRGLAVTERSVSGTLFAEDVGDVLLYNQGAAEFVYVPEALAMRRVSLDLNESTRRQVFESIARSISPSDILNIGAGADTTLIEAFQKGGHAVFATDFARNVVSELASRVHVPTFAGDLVELDALLPPLSVDYVIGNSTLGFVAPVKLERVLRNVVRVARRGGIFTFDLTPHSDYYLLAQGAKAATQTCINASRPDPQVLLECVSRLGPVQGVLAAAAYSNRLGTAVQLGLLLLLRQLFAEMGWAALVTWQKVDYVQGAQPLYILRVSRDAEGFGDIPQTETRIDDFDEYFKVYDFSRFVYLPSSMDRERAAVLAPLLGIKCSQRDAPLRVIKEVTEIVYANPDTGANADIMRKLAPSKVADVLMPYVRHGAEYIRPGRMREAVETDQVVHTQMIEGTLSISEDKAEMLIDRGYELERQRAVEKEQDRLAKIRQEEEKKRRKQQKNTRKRNRGK